MGVRILNRTTGARVVSHHDDGITIKRALEGIPELTFTTRGKADRALPQVGSDLILTAAFPEPAAWDGRDYRAALADTRPYRQWTFDGGLERPVCGTVERPAGAAARFPDAGNSVIVPGWPGREPGSAAWSWGAWLRADRAPDVIYDLTDTEDYDAIPVSRDTPVRARVRNVTLSVGGSGSHPVSYAAADPASRSDDLPGGTADPGIRAFQWLSFGISRWIPAAQGDTTHFSFDVQKQGGLRPTFYQLPPAETNDLRVVGLHYLPGADVPHGLPFYRNLNAAGVLREVRGARIRFRWVWSADELARLRALPAGTWSFLLVSRSAAGLDLDDMTWTPPQDAVPTSERYFPVLLHGADNTSGQELGYHVGGAATGALVIHLGTGDPPVSRAAPCRWKWHGRPASLDYRVRGGADNILLYQGAEPLNVHSGIVGDRTGNLVGDDTFEWEETPPNIRAHLLKSVLGSSPPASLNIEATTDVPDHALYSETLLDRASGSDTATTYAYHRDPQSQGLLATPPSVVVGQPFAVAFYLDEAKTKPFRIDDEPEYEASAAFLADGGADREVSRVAFFGNGTLQISFNSPLPAADAANGALLLAVAGETYGGDVTDAGDGHYTVALGAQVYGALRRLLEQGDEARLRFVRTDAAAIDESDWSYSPTGALRDAWRLTLRGYTAQNGRPPHVRVDAPVQRDGLWRYVHFTADAANVKAFVDGVEVGTASARYQGDLWNNPTPSATGAVRAFVSGRTGQDGSSLGTGITGALLADGSGRFPSIPLIDTDGSVKHIRQLAIRYNDASRVGIELSSAAGAVDAPVALTADAIAHYAIFIRVTQADNTTRHVIQSTASTAWTQIPPDAGDYAIGTTDDNDTNNWFQSTTGLMFDVAIVDTRSQYGFNRDEITVPGGHSDTVLSADWSTWRDTSVLPFWSPRVDYRIGRPGSPLLFRTRSRTPPTGRADQIYRTRDGVGQNPPARRMAATRTWILGAQDRFDEAIGYSYDGTLPLTDGTTARVDGIYVANTTAFQLQIVFREPVTAAQLAGYRLVVTHDTDDPMPNYTRMDFDGHSSPAAVSLPVDASGAPPDNRVWAWTIPDITAYRAALADATNAPFYVGIFNRGAAGYSTDYTLTAVTDTALPDPLLTGSGIGVIDEAASWSRVLTGADVLALRPYLPVERLFGGTLIEHGTAHRRGAYAADDPQHPGVTFVDHTAAGYAHGLAYRLIEDRLEVGGGSTVQDAVDAVLNARGVRAQTGVELVGGGTADIPGHGVRGDAIDQRVVTDEAGLMTFDYQFPTESLDAVCEQIGGTWEVDPWGALLIRRTQDVARTRTLSAVRDLAADEVNFTSNDDELRTRQVVLGGPSTLRSVSQTFHGEIGSAADGDLRAATAQPTDGVRTQWLLDERPTGADDMTITVITTSGSGFRIQHVYAFEDDRPGAVRDANLFWRLDGSRLTQINVDPLTWPVLAATDELVVNYASDIPIEASVTSPRIADYGLITHIEVDETLVTGPAAEARARALLSRNDHLQHEGEIGLVEGRHYGVRPGEGVVIRDDPAIDGERVWLVTEAVEHIINTAGGVLLSKIDLSVQSDEAAPPQPATPGIPSPPAPSVQMYAGRLRQTWQQRWRATHAPTVAVERRARVLGVLDASRLPVNLGGSPTHPALTSRAWVRLPTSTQPRIDASNLGTQPISLRALAAYVTDANAEAAFRLRNVRSRAVTREVRVTATTPASVHGLVDDGVLNAQRYDEYQVEYVVRQRAGATSPAAASAGLVIWGLELEPTTRIEEIGS